MRSLLKFLALGIFAVVGLATTVAADSLPNPRQEGLGPAQRLETLLERVRIELEQIGPVSIDNQRCRNLTINVEGRTITNS